MSDGTLTSYIAPRWHITKVLIIKKGKQLDGRIDGMFAPQDPLCGSVTFIES